MSLFLEYLKTSHHHDARRTSSKLKEQIRDAKGTAHCQFTPVESLALFYYTFDMLTYS